MHIVKRKGHREAYDNHKVYASCYAACLNAHLTEVGAEKICNMVMQKVDRWIAQRSKVSSKDISKEIAIALREENRDAAFMYETHRDIS